MVTDLSNASRRLDESNYNLSVDKDNLTNKLWANSAECKNLNAALAEYRTDAVRRENECNDKINFEEREINSEREAMRNLVAANVTLTKN